MPRAVAAFRAVDWPVIPYPIDYKVDPRTGLRAEFQSCSTGSARRPLPARNGPASFGYWLMGWTRELFPAPGDRPIRRSVSLDVRARIPRHRRRGALGRTRPAGACSLRGAASRFLIDCGEGTQRQLMRAELGFRGWQHILLTHAHLDHVLGLAGLLATLALYRVGTTVEIIGSGETLDSSAPISPARSAPSATAAIGCARSRRARASSPAGGSTLSR